MSPSLNPRPKLGGLLCAALLAVAGTCALTPPAHAAPTLLDITRSLTLRNILNGSIQLNLLANSQPSDAGATVNVIGETLAAGVEVGEGTTQFTDNGGTQNVTINEHSIGQLVPGEKVQATVTGVETKGGVVLGTSTVTQTLTCGQRDSSGTLTCS
ncbi:hypothetical protein ACGFRG_22045 [Streptomyces sp. NPDC048696]|uniref:hypothetical protein n=1 Tax=Streptomyces sp. NPDC048696 TaxID=3365585 RepID=UPI0037245E42